MRIVTGHKGTDHITSNDLQGFNQGIFGSGNYVLPVGNKFAAEMVDSTRLSIMDGEGIMQGVHFRNAPLTVTLLTLDSGVSGKNRIDLICARYTKDNSTGVENVSWQVIKGTATTGAPSEPSYTTGDILGGDLTADFPMFKVTFTGLTPVLTTLFGVKTLKNLYVFQAGTSSPISADETKVYFHFDLTAAIPNIDSIDDLVIVSVMQKGFNADSTYPGANVWITPFKTSSGSVIPFAYLQKTGGRIYLEVTTETDLAQAVQYARVAVMVISQDELTGGTYTT